MTRTHQKYVRAYINGYDVSGQARQVGTCGAEFDAPMDAALSDEAMNTLLGRASIMCGPINSFLAPSAATGVWELLNPGTGTRNVMIPIGTLAEPAIGDNVFAWTFEQSSVQMEDNDGFVPFNATLPATSYAGSLNYSKPWGLLVHAKTARTAANTAVGTIDNAASSALGGIFVYQLFSSDGTVTLSIDDSATNANNAAFSALSGATSGSIDASVTPKSGFVQLSTTATVRRYLRWQIALGTATTCTFAIAFIRG